MTERAAWSAHLAAIEREESRSIFFWKSCISSTQKASLFMGGGIMNADELAIRNLVAHWHSASAAGDVEAVLRFMDENVVFLAAGHPPMKGRSTFEQGLRGLLASHRIESTSEIQEIEVSGNLAYCWSVLNVRVIPKVGGDPVIRSGSAVSILRKQTNGSWLMVRDANLLAVET
jgi:uncharacterized protein (TIGR02246 family)